MDEEATVKKEQEQISQQEIRDRRATLMKVAQVYEDSIEPRITLLAAKIEEQFALSQLPLTHINLVLDLLKARLLDMADDAYIKNGKEQLKKGRRLGGRIG